MPLPARAQVVVVGAGLAGLSAAVRLRAAGVDVHVAEAAGHAGGRLATERIDGFVVDRGFQVLNTGYPRAADLDLDALALGWFRRGARVPGCWPPPSARPSRRCAVPGWAPWHWSGSSAPSWPASCWRRTCRPPAATST